jgi:acyl carrier protein
MRAPVFDRVRTIAADVFNVASSEITERSSPQSVASWDSIQHLNLILALEQEFDIAFEPEEMEQMGSIDRILAIVEAKLGHRV